MRDWKVTIDFRGVLQVSVAASVLVGTAFLLCYQEREKSKAFESTVNAMDDCSSQKSVKSNPGEWIKCVAYKSGYQPLLNEQEFLDNFTTFNAEVGKRVARKACIEAPSFATQQGMKNPLGYLMSFDWTNRETDRLVNEKFNPGGRRNFWITFPFEQAKALGASPSLVKAIQKSGNRGSDDGNYLPTEYNEQLAKVIQRRYFFEAIGSDCPAKLNDLRKPL